MSSEHPAEQLNSSPQVRSGTTEEDAPFSGKVFRDVLERLDVGIVIANQRVGRVVYRNPAARDVLANLMDEITYPAIIDRLLKKPLDDADLSKPLELRSGNSLLSFAVHRINRDCLCILIRDTTEKSRLMAIAEAVNTMNNIGYVFSGIRHEIGNPINSVKMTMSVLKHRLREFAPEMVEEYIARTLSEIARVEFLLKSLRNFSMFENLDLCPLDLADFLKKFASMSACDMEKRGIALCTRIPSRTVMVKADARALQQVLLNLVANASAALGGCEKPRISLILKEAPHLVTLAVQDNGCGLSPAELENLFKPFFTTKAEGSGLGLVICRKMLAQMNSSIDMQSVPGKGTTAIITLPAEGSHVC